MIPYTFDLPKRPCYNVNAHSAGIGLVRRRRIAAITCLPAGRCVLAKDMYYVYAIRSKSHKYIYIGMTANLEQRIKLHNRRTGQWSKRYRPWQLIYSESVVDRVAGRKREKELKSGSGREFIKKYAGIV